MDLEHQIKKKEVQDEINSKNLNRLEEETRRNDDLKSKTLNLDIDNKKLSTNLNFHKEQAERYQKENRELVAKNIELESQLNQVINKIQGHFKIENGHKVITNEEWILQQKIDELNKRLVELEKEKEKLLILNHELKKQVPNKDKYITHEHDLDGSY